MLKVCFICHGNICRSTMAEYVFKDMLNKEHLSNEVDVCSRATSTEALGEDIYPNTKEQLIKHNIKFDKHVSKQIKKSDYDECDYLIVMDSSNQRDLMCIIEEDPDNKVYKLLDFTESKGDIADPWYTRDFDFTWMQISKGCKGLLSKIKNDIN